MKILFVVTDLNVGGITSSVINFCNELSRRGHNVTLLNMDSCNKLEDSFDGGITLKHFKGLERFWQLRYETIKKTRGIKKVGLLLLGMLKKVTNRCGLWNKIIFKKHEEIFDVAVAFRQCAPCYCYVLKKVIADKKIGFVHGDVNFINGAEKTFIKYMPKFDKIAYVADAVKNNFIDKYPILKANACTVYNIFDSDQIETLAKEENPYKFDRNVVNVITVSRITNWDKRIDWIPQIVERLTKLNCKPFHWYIVGDGADIEKDRRLAAELRVEDHITFTGKLDNPFCVLIDADFMVLTSKTEAYPMAVIESLILKKPVVTTAYSSAKEVIIDGQNGLVASHDLDDLTNKIFAMINDESGVFTACNKHLLTYEYSKEQAYNQFIGAVSGEN